MSKEISVGHLAKRTGLAVSAIHFYETIGLVKPLRNRAGHRCYKMSDLRRLSFVKIAQELGFPLSEITSQLKSLPDERTPTKADWTKISRGFQKNINERITRLSLLRDKLDGCIGCGCLSLKSCALYNPKDRAGQKGKGARHLMLDH